MVHTELRLNDTIAGGAPCHIVYFLFDDSIVLINDAQNALVARVPFGSLINNLTFNVATFAGEKKVYMTSFDKTGAVSHWLQTGTFVVQ